MFSHQSWTDGEEYTFMVNETDKEGLSVGDDVVLLTGINSSTNNTRIYGSVVNLSNLGKIRILVDRTVIE